MLYRSPAQAASRQSKRDPRLAVFLTPLIVLATQQTARPALPWPAKTGPDGTGVARGEDAQGVPIHWSDATGENILWKVPLEGAGHSTPVIGNGRIWLTSATADGTRQYIYCLDADTGQIIHHKLLFENASPEPLGNDINSYASPTCVLTDDALYVHFGTYGTARLDPATADVVWQRRDIEVRHFRGPGSSPIVWRDRLFLSFDGVDEQFLMALDTRSGDTVWRTDRTTDYHDLGPDGLPQAGGDLRKAFATPVVAEVNGRGQLISVGARAAFGYDALTGEELWTVLHDDYNAAAQPLLLGDLVIMNTGSRGANLLAVRLADGTRGDVTESHVVWNRTGGNSDLSFPVLVGERIYFATDNGVATCVDARSGAEVWRGRLGGKHIASPVVAGGNLYFSDTRGTTWVVRAGDTFELLATNRLDEGLHASPAVADGALYLRTFGHLYKIAEE